MPSKLAYDRWLPILRRIILVFLIVFLITIAVSIIFSSGKRISRKTENLVHSENQAVSVLEKFQAMEFSGQKRKISLKAEKYYLDEAGNQHLEGQVEMADEEVPEKIILRARKMLIEANKKNLLAEGGVEIKASGLLIKASALEYNFEQKKVRSSQTKIIWQNLSIVSKKMVYSVQSQRGILEDGVEGKTLKSDAEFTFITQKITLDGEKNLLLAEAINLIAGQLEARAFRGAIYLNEAGDDFERIELEGKTALSWHDREFNSDFTEINLTSEKLNLLRLGNVSVLRSDGEFQVEGRGHLWRMEGTGRDLGMDFFDNQKAEKFYARNMQIKFSRTDGEEFILSGQQIEHNLLSGKLLVLGEAKGKFKDYELQAKHLHLWLADRSFEAEDSRLEVKPEFFSRSVALFKKDQPVFMSGFQALAKPESIEFTGKIRIWQNESYFLADKARLEKETGKVILEGRVKASLPYQNSETGPGKVDLTGEMAGLLLQEKKLVINGLVNLQMDGLKLQAKELRLFFDDRTPDRLSHFEASGQVAVFWKEYLAKSQQAIYKPEENIVIMNGLPELINFQGDHLEADKLTLFLSDDRIQAENQKRERSLTILVRGK